MSPQRPSVSVVVPTRNRVELLRRSLDSLDLQQYPAFDVWVVDDASSDGTAEFLACWQGSGRNVLRQDRPQGGYAARNRGWRSSTGSIVAFTDDDCITTGRWLDSLVVELLCTGAAGVQGVTLAEPGTPTPFTHQIEQRLPGAPYRTCNVAYTRAALERLGGFDDRFFYYADTLFGLHARSLGGMAFAPNAVVLHPPRAKEWRTRSIWERRMREGARFREMVRDLGMTEGERRDIEPFLLSRSARGSLKWIMAPIQEKLLFHMRYFVHHPAAYAVGFPHLVRERYEMLLALIAIHRHSE